MTDTPTISRPTTPEELAERLVATQLALAELINLNLHLLRLLEKAFPADRSAELYDLSNAGFELFDRLVDLTRGKPHGD